MIVSGRSLAMEILLCHQSVGSENNQQTPPHSSLSLSLSPSLSLSLGGYKI